MYVYIYVCIYIYLMFQIGLFERRLYETNATHSHNSPPCVEFVPYYHLSQFSLILILSVFR